MPSKIISVASSSSHVDTYRHRHHVSSRNDKLKETNLTRNFALQLHDMLVVDVVERLEHFNARVKLRLEEQAVR